MEKEPKLPPHNPELEKHLIDAFIGGDTEFFEDLGGRIVSGKSKEEVLNSLKERNYSLAEKLLSDLNRDFHENENLQSEETSDRINEIINEMRKELLDDESDFYTNTAKGSVSEVIFRAIEKNFPGLGLEIRDDAVDRDNLPRPEAVAVHTSPHKTDRVLLLETLEAPSINVLKIELGDPEGIKLTGEAMEENGELPIGTTKKILARYYKTKLDNPGKYTTASEIAEHDGELAKLGVEPITDKEIEELVVVFIDNRLKKERGF